MTTAMQRSAEVTRELAATAQMLQGIEPLPD